jgi:hypothetical protein
LSWRYKQRYCRERGKPVNVKQLFRRNPVRPADGWAKSSLSSYNGNCVEVAGLDGDIVWMRDSKDPGGKAIGFPADQWDVLVDLVRSGAWDRRTRTSQ